ncbi:hypothetical protein [Pseudoxanthomonas mexicana]
MTEVADLRIRVQTDGVAKGSADLDRLTASGGKAERATDSLLGTLGKFASVAAVMAGVAAAGAKLVAVQRQFDIINAGLVTATGSAENAAVAFEAIQDFATETPFSLQQVSEAFTKLVNYGLTPSERALTAYGDMSAALGKDLMMLIEAVADASTGEFERLKEFGVKARKEGDNVSLTFRGITTTVRNSSDEIEKYLIELSENNFAGNMAARMDTLDGALSNLGDEWDKLFLNLSQSGIGDAISDGVRIAIDLLGELNDYISSGQFEGHIEAMGTAFGPWAEDASEAVDIVSKAIGDLVGWIESEYPEVGDVLTDAWRDFPENIRAVIQLATVHVAWFVEEVRSYAQAIEETWDAVADGMGGQTLDAAEKAWDQRRAANRANLSDSIDMHLQERQATIDATKAAIDGADARRQAWEQERAARAKANEGTDRLAGFRQNGGAASRASAGDDGETRKRQREFQSLVDSLRTEEEAIAESYSERRAIIERNTAAESEQRRDLMSRLDAWRTEEEAAIREKQDRELDAVRESLRSEEDSIRESYERRRQVVADSQSLSDEARAKLLERLATERDIELAAAEQSRIEKRARLLEDIVSDEEVLAMARDRRLAELQAAYDEELILKEEFERAKAELEKKYAEDSRRLQTDNFVRTMDQYGATFGALGDMFGQFAQGQGKSAERMFKISKALNMATAVMGIAAGIAKANAELSYPMNIIEGVRIAAVGATQIAAISQQRFSGAYDDGGRIPAGQFGIVGERGMEFVEGPAQVTSRRDTARMLREAADGGDRRGGDVNVYIDVSVDARGNAQATTQVTGDGDDQMRAKQFAQLVDLRVRDVILREQRQGGLLSGNR